MWTRLEAIILPSLPSEMEICKKKKKNPVSLKWARIHPVLFIHRPNMVGPSVIFATGHCKACSLGSWYSDPSSCHFSTLQPGGLSQHTPGSSHSSKTSQWVPTEFNRTSNLCRVNKTSHNATLCLDPCMLRQPPIFAWLFSSFGSPCSCLPPPGSPPESNTARLD